MTFKNCNDSADRIETYPTLNPLMLQRIVFHEARIN